MEKAKRVDITLRFFKKTVLDRLKAVGRGAVRQVVKIKPKVYHHFSHILICEVKMKIEEFRQGFGQLKEYRGAILRQKLVKEKSDVLAFLGLPEEECDKIDDDQWNLLEEDELGLIVYFKSGRVGKRIRLERE